MPDPAAEMYVELLTRALLGELAPPHVPLVPMEANTLPKKVFVGMTRLAGVTSARPHTPDPIAEREGRSFPLTADSMIGRARMENLRDCALSALEDDVPGDFIETGVWRGGASILMRGILAAYGDTRRRVWVADSFKGLPPANPEKYPEDAKMPAFHEWEVLAVSLAEVRANFDRYDLLDDRVMFLEGWFKDTLPGLDNTWSLIRLDGDLYESTIDAISALYPTLSIGGYLIVDDYEAVGSCKSAITDYRAEHGITEPLQVIDWTGVYWRRERRGRRRLPANRRCGRSGTRACWCLQTNVRPPDLCPQRGVVRVHGLQRGRPPANRRDDDDGSLPAASLGEGWRADGLASRRIARGKPVNTGAGLNVDVDRDGGRSVPMLEAPYRLPARQCNHFGLLDPHDRKIDAPGRNLSITPTPPEASMATLLTEEADALRRVGERPTEQTPCGTGREAEMYVSGHGSGPPTRPPSDAPF